MANASMSSVSVNQLSHALLERLIADAQALRLETHRLPNGTTIVDAGMHALGGLEAGRQIAQICLGGLGTVTLTSAGNFPDWPLSIHVHTANPVLACLGSQYAGWDLSYGEGKERYSSLGSGPGRVLAAKEALFTELGYHDHAQETCLVLEVDAPPPLALTDKIAHDCGIEPENLVLIITPTTSLCGAVQIVSRVLEVALHKAHELGFPLEHIVDGAGSAPVPPPSPDFVTAMGRTNDAILFGGMVHLFVGGEADAARDLAAALPSSQSKDYGRCFAEVFKSYKYDFFQIDPMLFSPARVAVHAIESGSTYMAGQFDESLLQASFGVMQ